MQTYTNSQRVYNDDDLGLTVVCKNNAEYSEPV